MYLDSFSVALTSKIYSVLLPVLLAQIQYSAKQTYVYWYGYDVLEYQITAFFNFNIMSLVKLYFSLFSPKVVPEESIRGLENFRNSNEPFGSIDWNYR